MSHTLHISKTGAPMSYPVFWTLEWFFFFTVQSKIHFASSRLNQQGSLLHRSVLCVYIYIYIYICTHTLIPQYLIYLQVFYGDNQIYIYKEKKRNINNTSAFQTSTLKGTSHIVMVSKLDYQATVREWFSLGAIYLVNNCICNYFLQKILLIMIMSKIFFSIGEFIFLITYIYIFQYTRCNEKSIETNLNLKNFEQLNECVRLNNLNDKVTMSRLLSTWVIFHLKNKKWWSQSWYFLN